MNADFYIIVGIYPRCAGPITCLGEEITTCLFFLLFYYVVVGAFNYCSYYR